MAEKRIAQKMYEKFHMLKHSTDQLEITVADRGDRPVWVLAIRTEHSFIPIAKLLTEEDINELTPKFEVTEKLKDIFDHMATKDDRLIEQPFDLEDFQTSPSAEFKTEFDGLLDEYYENATGWVEIEL